MLAALEVAPHALTFCLLCCEKMHEDCEGITEILPLSTELRTHCGEEPFVIKGNTPGGKEP